MKINTKKIIEFFKKHEEEILKYAPEVNRAAIETIPIERIEIMRTKIERVDI